MKSQAIRDTAKELYIIEGLTFEQDAEQTKVPVATLKRWAAKEDWQRKREEYLAERQNFKEGLAGLRDKMLEKALKSMDPQDIYPLVALEKLLASRTRTADAGLDEEADKKMTPEELLKYIRENVYGLR